MQEEGILTKMVGRKYSQPNYNHRSFPPVCGMLDKVSYEEVSNYQILLHLDAHHVAKASTSNMNKGSVSLTSN
jgi:hypothetical protein